MGQGQLKAQEDKGSQDPQKGGREWPIDKGPLWGLSLEVSAQGHLSTGAAFDFLGPQLGPGVPSGSMWDSEPVLPLTLANGALRSKQATWGQPSPRPPNSPGWSGPRGKERGLLPCHREGLPPLNVGGILRPLPGWGLVREARLCPGAVGSQLRDHQALAHRALGPQPRPRFRSSQKFIPLNGVPCVALINLLNLPERSGNALPHPSTEETGGGSGGW